MHSTFLIHFSSFLFFFILQRFVGRCANYRVFITVVWTRHHFNELFSWLWCQLIMWDVEMEWDYKYLFLLLISRPFRYIGKINCNSYRLKRSELNLKNWNLHLSEELLSSCEITFLVWWSSWSATRAIFLRCTLGTQASINLTKLFIFWVFILLTIVLDLNSGGNWKGLIMLICGTSAEHMLAFCNI